MSDDFSALLSALNAGDNEIRQSAEDKYARLDAKQKIELLVPATADGNLQDPHRALAAVLLRRTITGQWEECWDPLSKEQREQLKSGLIQFLVSQIFMRFRLYVQKGLEAVKKTIPFRLVGGQKFDFF